MFNKRKRESKKLQKKQLKGGSLITYTNPKSAVAEQFRTLRTNIEFAQIDYSLKTLLVSSSIPAEGKSTISSNLAYVMSQNDKKVLIVDADLRKPTVHRTFKSKNEVGLTTLLLNKNLDVNNAIQYNRDLGIYLLSSGPIPPNPSELLSSRRMGLLMEELNRQFDLIIYDAPPVTAVADPKILASKVDGVLLVIRDGFSKKEEIFRSKSELDKVKANIIGYVLNSRKVSDSKSYYGYYGLDEADTGA